MAYDGRLNVCLAFSVMSAFLTTFPDQAMGRQDPVYDIVIQDGRVMDPESGLDAIRNVGIRNGTIQRISEGRLQGRQVIAAAGLVVAPGFIDTDGYPENARLQVMDGVTAVLDLRRGTADVDRWYAERDGRVLINYGVGVGYPAVRDVVMPGLEKQRSGGGEPSQGEAARILDELRRGFGEGAVALGMGDSDRSDPAGWELIGAFRVAAEADAHVVATLRDDIWSESNITANLLQMLGASAMSGATLHIPHLTSSAGPHTPSVLWTIARANESGVSVSAESYPYRAAVINVARGEITEWSDDDIEQVQPIDAEQRLTRETMGPYVDRAFEAYVHNDNIEPFVVAALQDPYVTIASHASDREWTAVGRGHPRTSGTFSRVLGRYVRAEATLSLMEALRKMTVAPAQRLEARVPAMRRKGRVREGADADIVVFDSSRILDHATFQGQRASEGVMFVLVNGTVVVNDGAVQGSSTVGRPIRGPVRDGGSPSGEGHRY